MEQVVPEMTEQELQEQRDMVLKHLGLLYSNPDKHVTLQEQTIKDAVSGLTLKIEYLGPEYNAGCLLTIAGRNLPFGNQTFWFTKHGEFDGLSTAVKGVPL